ncbi:MAG: hypothetical protein ABID79_01135, partial [Elusimicrobiota bacterium]
HAAHSYWDFACGGLSGNAVNVCSGQSSSLCGPKDPQINYTYQWSLNGNPYTGMPNSTAQCIIPIAKPGDIFSVNVIQPSNCNFSIK